MDGQDWNPTILRNTAATGSKSSAFRTIAPKSSSAAQAERKLADATEVGKLKRLAPESRQALVQLRVGLKKNQTELNQMCSFPANTIREIEAGRLVPTIGQLNTLNRILKTGLRLE